jgi:hypothetical protein
MGEKSFCIRRSDFVDCRPPALACPDCDHIFAFAPDGVRAYRKHRCEAHSKKPRSEVEHEVSIHPGPGRKHPDDEPEVEKPEDDYDDIRRQEKYEEAE